VTYAAAAELGKELGLEQPAEHVNNVVGHATMLFDWLRIQHELHELRETARAAGVRFSTACGDAILDGDPEDAPCYICRKLGDA
jgi:hypothetical protein